MVLQAGAPFAESEPGGVSKKTSAVALQLAHYANRLHHWCVFWKRLEWQHQQSLGMSACLVVMCARLASLSMSVKCFKRCRKRRGPDATCIALTLRWPTTSLNQAFPTQKGSFMETQRQRLDPSTPSGRAKLRWRQVRMLFVQFRRARR